MICNSIIKVSQSNNINIRNTSVNNFGVSFQVDYDYQKDTKKLFIDYKIVLAKDGNKKFGEINSTYCFDVELENDPVEINEADVRKCLKENHYNIFEMIEDTMKEYGISYDDPYKKYMN